MPEAKIIVVVWILFGLAACSGCAQKGGHQPVVITALEDHAPNVPSGVEFSVDATKTLLENAIGKSDRLELIDSDNPKAYRAELLIVSADERETTLPQEKGVNRSVEVELSLSRWQDEFNKEKLIARGKGVLLQDPNSVNRQEGFDRALEQAIREAVEFIDLQLATQGFSEKDLAERLNSDRAEDRLYVLRALRERHAPQLVPLVIEKLSDPDPEVAMEAVGVLVAQKDSRAVAPLIRMAQGRDEVFLLQTITALSEIQGPEARGYLFTLAQGHISLPIRKRAQEALELILKDEGTKSSQTEGKAVALPRSDQGHSQPPQ